MGQQLLFCRCCAHGYSDAVMQQPQGAGIPRDAAPAGAATPLAPCNSLGVPEGTAQSSLLAASPHPVQNFALAQSH